MFCSGGAIVGGLRRVGSETGAQVDATGIEWALHHPDEVQDRLTAGQIYVAERFDPVVIGAKWAEVLQIPRAAAA